MATPELKLTTGDPMQLQVVGGQQDQKLGARVIGYLPGHSLIVSPPRTRGKPMLVREGQVYTVRLLIGSTAVGFTTSVIKSNIAPYPYLHLKYPKELASATVRTSPRATVDLAVTIHQAEGKTSRTSSRHEHQRRPTSRQSTSRGSR